MAATSGRREFGAGTEILVGLPARDDAAFLSDLALFCAESPAILAAYRAPIFVQQPGEVPHLAIGLLLSNDIDRSTLAEVANYLSEVSGDPFTLLALHPSDRDPIASFMLEEAEPFNHKQPFSNVPMGERHD